MTAPSPLQPCICVSTSPACVWGDYMYPESCSDCRRCGFSPCVCLQLRSPAPVAPDDADLELPDELALGALDPLLLFAPRNMLVPRDELHHWFPGLLDSADSERIAEALLFAELGPELFDEPWTQRGELSEAEERSLLAGFEEFVDDELRNWSSITGRPIGFSPELGEAVSNDGDSESFALEPSGHGRHAAGHTRCRGSNHRAGVDALFPPTEREPERRGRPVLRPRSGRRAAGGLARRAKPQGGHS